MGLILGIGFGCSIGVVFHNIPLGVILGIGVGLAFGNRIKNRDKDKK